MRAIIFVTATLFATAQASASGGLWCTVDDASIKLSLDAGVTRGLGSPVFSLKGELAIAAKGIPDDFKTVNFELPHLAQYWLDGHELKLLLYREREAEKKFGYVELTIETRTDDVEEKPFEGPYTLKIYDVGDDSSAEGKSTELKGTVSCSVE